MKLPSLARQRSCLYIDGAAMNKKFRTLIEEFLDNTDLDNIDIDRLREILLEIWADGYATAMGDIAKMDKLLEGRDAELR